MAEGESAQAVSLRLGSRRQGERSFDSSESLRISAVGLNTRRTPQLSGRSLELVSNDRPRGMTVTAATPYRIRLIGLASLVAFRFERDLKAFNFAARDPSLRLRSGFPQQSQTLTLTRILPNIFCILFRIASVFACEWPKGKEGRMKRNLWINGNHGGKLLTTLVVAAILMALPAGMQSQDKKGSNHSIGFILSHDATLKQVGLPAYPGAQRSKDTSDDSSALQMGLWGGNSGFKLAVLKLDSSDSPEKVAAYYRKALARYGSVLDCSKPASRHSGNQSNELACDNDQATDGGYMFKSGTQQSQHVVGIETRGNHTTISLVYLETPESANQAD